MSGHKLISQQNLSNLQLSVELLAQINDIVNVTSSNQLGLAIDARIKEFAEAANQNGNLHKAALSLGDQSIQLIFTVGPPNSEDASAESSLGGFPAVWLDGRIAAMDIYDDLEQAFKDYGSLGRLDRNPLVSLFQTDLAPFTKEEPTNPGGLALRHLLDRITPGVYGVAEGVIIPQTEWRAEHYLHLRYRRGITHKALAEALGFSERHLQRHRREQIRQAAALCVGGSITNPTL